MSDSAATALFVHRNHVAICSIAPPCDTVGMTLANIRSLDYTVLICTRLEDTVAFYRDTMKFRLTLDRPNWKEFAIGSQILALRPRGKFPIAEDGPLPAGTVATQLAFRVAPADFDACHAELLAAEVRILRGPTDLPDWRHHTLFFADPENNILEIYAEI